MQVPEELKLKYLNRRIMDIQSLRNGLERDDFSFAMTLGHQVKGNALTFDFPELAFIGLEIEKAGKRHDKEKLKVLAKNLEHAVHAALKNSPPVFTNLAGAKL